MEDAVPPEAWSDAESVWERTRLETREPPKDSGSIWSSDWKTHRSRYRTVGDVVFVSVDGGPWEEAVWIKDSQGGVHWVPASRFPEYRTPEGRAKRDAEMADDIASLWKRFPGRGTKKPRSQ